MTIVLMTIVLIYRLETFIKCTMIKTLKYRLYEEMRKITKASFISH